MKSLLICPEEAPALRDLTRSCPVAALPLFGKPLIAYWIEHLAVLGVTKIIVLASDRPEHIRRLVGDGTAWGIEIEVVPTRHTTTPEEARTMYVEHPEDWLPAPYTIVDAQCLPNYPDRSILTSLDIFFTAVRCWMPYATKNRVGMKELAPGIWAASRCTIARSAVIKAPCWIEESVHIGEGATIGPMTILANNVIVGRDALISHSIVQPDTYVGELTNVEDSIVVGSTLINWKSGSSVRIQDSFLLGDLGKSKGRKRSRGLFGSFLALSLLTITTPLALVYTLSCVLRGKQCIEKRTAAGTTGKPEVIYYRFKNLNDYAARWPQLWSIVRGEFVWFGNRPLTPTQATQLRDEFEKLWLESPIGLFSQGDAAACWDLDSDEAKAHASFYSTQRTWRANWNILKRVLVNRPGHQPDNPVARRSEQPQPARFANNVTVEVRRL